MHNLPISNAGYADGTDLDEWTPFDSDLELMAMIRDSSLTYSQWLDQVYMRT